MYGEAKILNLISQTNIFAFNLEKNGQNMNFSGNKPEIISCGAMSYPQVKLKLNFSNFFWRSGELTASSVWVNSSGRRRSANIKRMAISGEAFVI
ncbi:hypothetical protein LIER_18162 [Lithospermum erythrorhizon]|uniref:Uncharacterized protein n=1 Tax=Lithospermum erythrorhizon TaxID=34254 RepID=A0AAV3QFJ2_LITER